MTSTITQNGALLKAHLTRRPGGDIGIALRFYDKRLTQLRALERRQKLLLLALRFRLRVERWTLNTVAKRLFLKSNPLRVARERNVERFLPGGSPK